MADPQVVLNLIDGFRGSKAMFSAASLGVFDRVPATAEELSKALEVNPDAMERLLDACVGLGLLVRAHGSYDNAPAAQVYLTSRSPDTLLGYVLYSEKLLYPLWGKLEDAVREGTNRWEQVFGGRGALFDNFLKDEASKRAFLAGMHGMGILSSPAVAAAFDLSGFRHFADLGGATGHLASAICHRWPHINAEVFDLPEVIAVASEYPRNERVTLKPGDFFRGELPRADLYGVGRILHDWSEPRILELLARMHAALAPGGAVLIAEKLLDEDKSGPTPAHLQSLNMLVCTEGKERTESEYRTLLEQVGFRKAKGHRTGKPVDALIAWKA